MTRQPPTTGLSRRERQIMEILYRIGEGGVTEVLDNLQDPPSYSAVRSHLRILEEKGHLRHEQRGSRYVFSPTVPVEKARRNALNGLMRNFFEGSREQLVATLLDLDASKLSADELDRLAALIDEARQEGR